MASNRSLRNEIRTLVSTYDSGPSTTFEIKLILIPGLLLEAQWLKAGRSRSVVNILPNVANSLGSYLRVATTNNSFSTVKRSTASREKESPYR